MQITLDSVFKVVMMFSAGIAIGTFFFTFQTKDDSRDALQAVNKRIDRVEIQSQNGDDQIRGQFNRLDQKLDDLKTILLRREK